MAGNKATAPAAAAKKYNEPEEEIVFNERDEQDGFQIGKDSTVINLYPSRTSNKLTGSKFKFENLVDYGWESDYGNGQLISTHMSGRYIAYVIKVNNVGAVRIVDLSNNERVLMKAQRGSIRDVDFVHKLDELVVGFIDEVGTIYINKVIKDKTSGPSARLIPKPLLQITNDVEDGVLCDHRRFIWCKFVPDELGGNEFVGIKDCAFHFTLLQNDRVIVANANQILDTHGEGTHSFSSLEPKIDYMTIDTHSSTVTDASFAPDGTALCTSGRDGLVNFFQVYFASPEPPRCLYSWAPHDGDPVSKIFFLDDHNLRQNNDSQYWKYMLTANERKTEIKIWTCKSWTCLQTLNFCTSEPSLYKMDLDIGAKYLAMTDVHRKSIYLFYMAHGEDYARFDWVNEFSLPVNIISFNINAAKNMSMTEIIKKGYDNFIVNPPAMRPIDHSNLCYLEMFFIQPKSLQKGNIAFHIPKSYYESQGGDGLLKLTNLSLNGGLKEQQQQQLKETSDDMDIIVNKNMDIDDDDDDEEDDEDDEEVQEISGNRLGTEQANKNAQELAAAITKLANNSQDYNSKNNKSNKLTSSPPQQGISQSSFFSSQNQNSVLTEQLSHLIGVGGGGGSLLSKSKSHSPNIISPNPNEQVVVMQNYQTSIDIQQTKNQNDNRNSSSSSPSREVEEIMSPKVNHEMGGRSETSQSLEASLGGLGGSLDDDNHNQIDKEKVTAAKSIHKVLSIKQKVLSGADIIPTTQIPQVLEQVNSLMELMKAQNSELRDLKREVSRLNTEQRLQANKSTVDEKSLARVLEHHYSNIQTSIGNQEAIIKNIMVESTSKANTPHFPPNLAEIISINCGKMIKSEMETTLLPSIMHIFEPTRNHIQVEVEGLVHVAEARIKQDMRHHLQSENFMETLVPEIAHVIKSTCEGVITEHFSRSLIPSFEKALQNIFAQVNNTFLSGTKEYLNSLQNALETHRKDDRAAEVIREQFSGVQDHLAGVFHVEIENQMHRVLTSVNGIQGGIVNKMEDTLSKELLKAFKDQQKYLEICVIPRALTPAVSISDHMYQQRDQVDLVALQQQIENLIIMGDIPEAFKLATNHGDTNLLMTICKNLNPNKVLTPQLPLVTRLAIIQQMGVEINGHTETKLQYLQLAVSTLESSDRRVLHTISKVLPLYQVSSQRFLQQNPESKLTMSLRLVEMAMKSICMSFKPSFPAQQPQQPQAVLGLGGTQSFAAIGGGGSPAGNHQQHHHLHGSIKHEDFSPF